MREWNDKRLDDDGVWLMKKPVKIYVFKDEDIVKITFRLTDYSNYSRRMTVKQFETICENWDKPDGIDGLKTDDGKYWWYLSRSGPRPESISARFVCVNINSFHFRFSEFEMNELIEEFKRQKTQENHWD